MFVFVFSLLSKAFLQRWKRAGDKAVLFSLSKTLRMNIPFHHHRRTHRKKNTERGLDKKAQSAVIFMRERVNTEDVEHQNRKIGFAFFLGSSYPGPVKWSGAGLQFIILALAQGEELN